MIPKKIRFSLEYSYRYIQQNILFVLLGIFISTAFVSQSTKIIRFLLTYKKETIIIGIEGLYNINNLPREISSNITFGITEKLPGQIKHQGSPIVVSIESGNNNQHYIIKLDTSKKWHNKKSLQSQDINLNIDGIQTAYPDTETLDITLPDTFSPIMSLLSKPIFYKNNLIGLGEYQAKAVSYRDGYYKEIKLVSTKDILVYRFYPNEKDLITAYKLGQVDKIITRNLPDEFASWPKTKISPRISSDKYIAVFINTEKINNKQLRQALAYAAPKTTDLNERCLSPISPSSWAYNPQVKEYEYNPLRAQEIYSKNRLDRELQMLVSDRQLLSTAESIINSWQNSLKINVSTSFNLTVDNADLIIAQVSIPEDPDQYPMWHSTQQQSNISKLNNSRIDKLLEEGRRTIDIQARKEMYFDFQKYLLEESPAIFLKYPTEYQISRIK